jgi:hypothetical protein
MAMQRVTRLVLAVALVTGLAACSSMSPEGRTTAERTVGGGAIGAAGGAIIGAIAGNAGLGAAAGAGAGLIGGYIYDQYEKGKTRSYQEGVAEGRREAQRGSSGN